MTFAKKRFSKLAFVTTRFLCTLALFTSLSSSQKAFATEKQTSNRIIAQEIIENPTSSTQPTDFQIGKELQQKIDKFRKNLESYKEKEINGLRGINQRFSIGFIVSGITLTLISTAIGAVESQNQNVQQWTNFAIVTLGAGAVASQALNSAFPVTRRAGAYALIEAEITILEFKIDDVTNEEQLKEIKNEFYNLIREIGKAESVNE